jgi:hypothetical protein
MDSWGGGAVHAWCDLKWGGCSEREAFAATNNDPNAGAAINVACRGGVTGHFTQACLLNE